MSEKNIKIAAKTMMSMCKDYLTDGITTETFVSNVKMFGENLEKELPGGEQEKGTKGFMDNFFKRGKR